MHRHIDVWVDGQTESAMQALSEANPGHLKEFSDVIETVSQRPTQPSEEPQQLGVRN
jgi:hypothetical protein